MKDIRVETVSGGIFILKDCTKYDSVGIIHMEDGGIFLYTIQEGDKLTEI